MDSRTMTKTIRNLIAALLLIGASNGAMAKDYYQNGNKLLASCEGENIFNQDVCVGYLQAVEDTYNSAAEWKGFESDICAPISVTGGQLIKVWVKYANEHPEKLHLSASDLVLLAYRDAFPCD